MWMNCTAKFLSRYASVILGAGSTSARCEMTVLRMANAWDLDADITILPRSVMMSVRKRDTGESMTVHEKIPAMGVNFYFISRLSQLSWKVRDEKVSPEEAAHELDDILAKPRLSSVAVTVLTGMANASFCRLFDGDWAAMAIVFVATVNGFWLKNALHGRWGWDMRLATLAAACSSSIIASCGFLFHVTSTPDVALGTSVLYHIPGILYINSVSDLIHGHLLCSVSRFINACVITACLGIGLSLGILIMNIQYF